MRACQAGQQAQAELWATEAPVLLLLPAPPPTLTAEWLPSRQCFSTPAARENHPGSLPLNQNGGGRGGARPRDSLQHTGERNAQGPPGGRGNRAAATKLETGRVSSADFLSQVKRRVPRVTAGSARESLQPRVWEGKAVSVEVQSRAGLRQRFSTSPQGKGILSLTLSQVKVRV